MHRAKGFECQEAGLINNPEDTSEQTGRNDCASKFKATVLDDFKTSKSNLRQTPLLWPLYRFSTKHKPQIHQTRKNMCAVTTDILRSRSEVKFGEVCGGYETERLTSLQGSFFLNTSHTIMPHGHLVPRQIFQHIVNVLLSHLHKIVLIAATQATVECKLGPTDMILTTLRTYLEV